MQRVRPCVCRGSRSASISAGEAQRRGEPECPARAYARYLHACTATAATIFCVIDLPGIAAAAPGSVTAICPGRACICSQTRGQTRPETGAEACRETRSGTGTYLAATPAAARRCARTCASARTKG